MATTSLKSHFETVTETKPPISVEREIGKQGLRKQFLRKGTSWKTPLPGDEVQVHFSGHIDGGACLASSRDTGTPFCLKLGQGEVIKGWDEGVATMKKGERTIRDITGDGGILKKIIKEGEGWATPRDNDEVLVKYEARLQNGALVSESNEGVEFRVFDGHLCPAISKAVRTMRRGEKAELAVKFSCKSVLLVPSKAMALKMTAMKPPTLKAVFHLSRIRSYHRKSVVDITGDQKVLKKIKKAGQGFDRPNKGSLVKVIYIGRLEDGAVFETKGTNEEPFEFTTREENVNEGLERVIMTMKKEEQATETISAEYLCGHEVSELVSANSVLYYEVTLIDFTKEKPFWKMDSHEKIEACERKKHDGNLQFRAGKYWRASKKYEKAAKIIEFDITLSLMMRSIKQMDFDYHVI